MKTNLASTALFLTCILLGSAQSYAEPPATSNGVTSIHLDEHNGYFAARETLVDLKPGQYEFVVTNKADKLVGFWLQDAETKEMFDRFPLAPGETRTTRVTLTEHGFRYRCPINPTPWYEVSVSR